MGFFHIKRFDCKAFNMKLMKKALSFIHVTLIWFRCWGAADAFFVQINWCSNKLMLSKRIRTTGKQGRFVELEENSIPKMTSGLFYFLLLLLFPFHWSHTVWTVVVFIFRVSTRAKCCLLLTEVIHQTKTLKSSCWSSTLRTFIVKQICIHSHCSSH